MNVRYARRPGVTRLALLSALLTLSPLGAETLRHPTPEALVSGREIVNVIDTRAQLLEGRDLSFKHHNAKVAATVNSDFIRSDPDVHAMVKNSSDRRGQELAWDLDDAMMAAGRGHERFREQELQKIKELAHLEHLAEHEANLAQRRRTTLSGKAGQQYRLGEVPKTIDARLTGTSPELTKGAMTDRDHATMRKNQVRSLKRAARKLGYHVRSGDGGSVTIVELDSTYFWKNPDGIDSYKSILDAEVMINKGVIPSANAKGPGAARMRAMNIYDNLKKSHGTLPKENFQKLLQPPENAAQRLEQWEKIHDMAKATKRIQLTMSRADTPNWRDIRFKEMVAFGEGRRPRFTFNEQLEILKQGYSPEAAGIVDATDPPEIHQRKMNAFHDRCRAVADKGAAFAVEQNRQAMEAGVKEYRRVAEVNPAKARELKAQLMRQAGITRTQKLAIIEHSGIETLAEMEGIKATQGWVDTRSGNPLSDERIARLKASGQWDSHPKAQRRIYVDARGERLTASRVRSRLLGTDDRMLAQLDRLRAPEGIDKVVARTRRVIAQGADMAKRAAKSAITKIYDGPYVDTGGPMSQKSPFSMTPGTATLMATNLYHSYNRSLDRVEQSVTADDTDLGLYGKMFASTLWYTSGLGWVEDVSRQDFGAALDTYRKARAEGKDPSLAFALAQGTLDTANTLVSGAVKGVTVQPLVNTWDLVVTPLQVGYYKGHQAAAERDQAAMEERVLAYKNEIARKAGVAERAFAGLEDKLREVQKLQPLDERQLKLGNTPKVESEDVALALDVQYGKELSAKLEIAKAMYRDQVEADGGKSSPEASAALKRLDQAREALEAFNADPTATRKRVQVKREIEWYKRQIRHSDRVRAAMDAGKPLPPPLSACIENVKEPLRWMRLSTEGLRKNKEGAAKEIAGLRESIRQEVEAMEKDERTHRERLAAMYEHNRTFTDEQDQRTHLSRVIDYEMKINAGDIRPHAMGDSRLEHQKHIRDLEASIAGVQKRLAEGDYHWHPMAETDREHRRMLNWARTEYAKWVGLCGE